MEMGEYYGYQFEGKDQDKGKVTLQDEGQELWRLVSIEDINLKEKIKDKGEVTLQDEGEMLWR
jgi:hypothetical protein